MATITQTMQMVQAKKEKTVSIKQTSPCKDHMTAVEYKFKNRMKLDPLRALEPARKKLSTLEAQRIMAVLVDSIKRTEVMGIFPFVLNNIQRFNVMLGTDLVEMLTKHKVIVGSFAELKARIEELLHTDTDRKLDKRSTSIDDHSIEDNASNASEEMRPYFRQALHDAFPQMSNIQITAQAEAAMSNLMLVTKQLQSSCKNILRHLLRNPSIVAALLKDQKPGEESEQLVARLNELRGILMGMLLTTPIEEQERSEYLKMVSQKEQHHATVIIKLEQELEAAQEDRDDEIRKKNEVIRKLQADLHHIEKFSEELIRRTKTDADKQEAADMKNSEGKQAKLQTETNTHRTELQTLVEENREREQQMRLKKFKIETEAENWIQKYDTDMGERQDEFEAIDKVYTQEKKQLHELEERFRTLVEEYEQIQAERRATEGRREAAERELQRNVAAVTIIQAFWRSFKVRKALKSRKKKGKKGKKGKK